MTKKSETIEGLRGICVISVMIFHYFAEYRAEILSGQMPGHLLLQLTNIGWIGVDIFFSISGYVVTLSLASSRPELGAIKNFFWRRAKRLFPIYYIATVIFTAVVIFISTDHTLKTNIWMIWVHFGNLAATLMMPLNDQRFSVVHFWSLSIEIQFYLVWPFLFLFLRRTQVMAMLVAVIIVSPILRLAAIEFGLHYNQVYSFTAFRLDGFAAGALFAMLHLNNRDNKRLDTLFSAIAFLLIPAVGYLFTTPVWHKTDHLVQTAGYSILGSASAALVALLHRKSAAKSIQTILNTRFLVLIGSLSYSLYVWHLLFSGWISEKLRLYLLGSSSLYWSSHIGLLFDVSVNLVFSLVLALLCRPIEQHFNASQRFLRAGQHDVPIDSSKT